MVRLTQSLDSKAIKYLTKKAERPQLCRGDTMRAIEKKIPNAIGPAKLHLWSLRKATRNSWLHKVGLEEAEKKKSWRWWAKKQIER